MADAFVEDGCFVAGSYAARELVEMAIDGRESAIASGYSALTVEAAAKRLSSCIKTGCTVHALEGDALDLLTRIVDDAEAAEDESADPVCMGCVGTGCGACLDVRGWL